MGLMDFNLGDIGNVFTSIRESITGEKIKDPVEMATHCPGPVILFYHHYPALSVYAKWQHQLDRKPCADRWICSICAICRFLPEDLSIQS